MPDDSNGSWATVAQQLGTGRSWASVMAKATATGAREATIRTAATKGWQHAMGKKTGDKNKKRAEKRKADQAAAVVASPAVSPPASSAKRQRPVAGAMAEVVAPAEPLTDTVMRARVMPEHTYRQAIARYFLFTLDRPPEDEWMGKCGTVSYIVAGLNLPKGSRGSVVDVLLDVEWCMENDVEYTGQRKIKARTQAAIALDSKEAKLIADGMEDRLGLRLVCEMVNTSRRLKGLMHEHEHDWCFFHDALKQMTDQRCMDWMEEKGYLKRWVLPKAGLNEGSAYYRNRPVGDSPELMPLDCSLNKDVDDAVARMVAITSIYRDKYGDDDLRVFSRATLPAQLSAYKRVWDPSFCQSRTAGAATAVRIEQDFARCFGEHLKKIREAQGCIVPGLGSRNGQRAVAAADQRQENRGGHQVKKGWDGTTRWIHPDAQPAWDERMRAAEEEASSQS
jgi:hypothetical protein